MFGSNVINVDLEDLLIQSTKVSKFLWEVIKETYLVNFYYYFSQFITYCMTSLMFIKTRIIALFV